MQNQTRVFIDGRTLLLLFVQCAGFVFVTVLCAFSVLPLWAGGLLSFLLMNLSFTTWHECSHGNFSLDWRVNHVAGILSSLFSPYPGYFARRREHLAHHRWEGDAALDPVYPRIQTSALAFPFRLTWMTIVRAGNKIPADFLPLSRSQRLVDFLTLLLILMLTVLALFLGQGLLLLSLLVLPRLAVFYLHAFYICWLPHAVANGGFEKYRVRDRGLLWRLLTVGQWAHGVHHRNPHIPWHRYVGHLPGRTTP